MKRKLPTVPFDPDKSIVKHRFGNVKRSHIVAEGVPLAKLIKRELNDEPEIVMLSKTRTLAAEKFRRLKTTLVNEQDGGPQVIVVTSTAPSEGAPLEMTMT